MYNLMGIIGSVKMWPTMTGGQVIEVPNFTVFTVLLCINNISQYLLFTMYSIYMISVYPGLFSRLCIILSCLVLSYLILAEIPGVARDSR
jgi:hypothetical protein